MTREEIIKGVTECVARVVAKTPDRIRLDMKIIDDCGADSLDLLDLIFQLEQAFNIKISPRDLERRTQAKIGDNPMEINGAYSPEALNVLKTMMPEATPDEFHSALKPSELPYRFRVETFVNLVSRMLEEQS